MIPGSWAEILQSVKPFGETDLNQMLTMAGTLAGFVAADVYLGGESLGRIGGIRDFAQGEIHDLPFSGAQLRIIYDVAKQPGVETTISAFANVVDLALLSQDRRVSFSSPAVMEAMGEKDQVTKTIGRNAFTDFLDFEFASGPVEATVILVGLDGLDKVNATFGPTTGDMVLAEVAERFRETLRSRDTISRLESDVFGIYCPEMSTEKAADLSQRLRNAVQAPIRAGENELRISACAGVVHRGKGEKSAEILLHGDAALRAAKEAGPGELAIYDGDIQVKAEDRRQLASEFIQAISNNELTTGRSPIVHLPAGTITGVEAHVIWNHPQHGRMDAGQFMDLAALLGRVGDVERAVLDYVLSGTGAAPGMRTGMNLSATTLRDTRSITRIAERVKASETKITFEVCEDDVSAGRRAVAENLSLLRQAGASIMLDDFGMTSGSLRTLHAIPLDGLKLHSSILDSGNPARATSVAKGVYASANELKLEVVHSGVDTDADLRLLLQLDAQISGRGFFAQGLAVESRVKSTQAA